MPTDITPQEVAEDWEGSYRPDAGAYIVSELEDAEILIHHYETPSYEGYAFTLFRRDGLLFEVNGSHCSCYGLEDQWSSEETSVEALRMRKWARYSDEDGVIPAQLTELFGGEFSCANY